jgi:hypothetical protein
MLALSVSMRPSTFTFEWIILENLAAPRTSYLSRSYDLAARTSLSELLHGES